MNKSVLGVAEAETAYFDELLGYHLRRLSVLVMSDFADSLAPLKLKPTDASVLMMIESNPGITQSEVGKALGILRANMAPLIGTLVRRGLIERERVDGRSQAMRLSGSGQSLCRQVKSITREHEKRLFGKLSDAAKTRLIAQIRGLWSSTSASAP